MLKQFLLTPVGKRGTLKKRTFAKEYCWEMDAVADYHQVKLMDNV